METRPADSSRGSPPCYAFSICHVQGGKTLGDIRLRVGDDDDLRLYAGHIGYGVRPEHRGHRFAAHAVQLVRTLATRHGMADIWITCDPGNTASRRTCELAGAEFVEIVELPPESDMYQDGERWKCRYRLPAS